MPKKIKSALISVFNKDGLKPILAELDRLDVAIHSTGGTYKFIEDAGYSVNKVEDLTSYPSILGGRVKTLHPKVFGGILAKREEDHLSQLQTYEIPEFDLVIVDLYPFEKTVASTDDEAAIIEKIDIGGIALIRAAAKNFNDVVVVPSMFDYDYLLDILKSHDGASTLEQRKMLASRAFHVSSHYDTAIFQYFNRTSNLPYVKLSSEDQKALRYGENPHQSASFYGDWTEIFTKLGGKDLSYNNLVDIDAALDLMKEFNNDDPTFAVLKHTNSCGIATRATILEAWKAALEADPVSAFGGILVSNAPIDAATAVEIDKIFYEVLVAPEFTKDALNILQKKKKRVLLELKHYPNKHKSIKTLLNGHIVQDFDRELGGKDSYEMVTNLIPNKDQMEDLIFANKCVKHLKSNTIVLVRNKQLLSMGCGQTSRVDALKQAIVKAGNMGLKLEGAVMASDAFFPFPDCVNIASEAGVKAVIQPGGSIKDNLSIEACDEHKMAMIFTGKRHFKH